MTGRSDSDKIDPDRGNTSGRLLFGDSQQVLDPGALRLFGRVRHCPAARPGAAAWPCTTVKVLGAPTRTRKRM